MSHDLWFFFMLFGLFGTWELDQIRLHLKAIRAKLLDE
jgi:hypothetical protein